jgi:hypothetical protein|tara:strand:- start:132 stop:422 length:291 start_codon:yes stop_codon:yes gene_type:complete
MNNEIKPPYEVTILDDAPVEVESLYRGVAVILTPLQVAVYDRLMGALAILEEHAGHEITIVAKDKTINQDDLIDVVDKGKEWFVRHYPDIYYALLD